jgi:hypothetical protein
MRQRIDWQRLWNTAVRLADASLNVFGETLPGGLPEIMPFTPEELTAPDFDMDRGLDRLAAVLKPATDHH